MSVDSSEIDQILSEDYGNIELADKTLEESVDEILNSGDPYMHLSVEEPFYIAGDWVEGNIFLDFPKDTQSVTLSVISYGLEEVYVYNQDLLITQTNNKLFSMNEKLKEWDKIAGGHYVVPFTFKIPNHCPPTFYYSGEDSMKNYVKAQISYSISVRAQYEKEEITKSRSIVIRSRDSRASSQTEQQTTETIMGICCISKGRTYFKLMLTNEYHPNVGDRVFFKLVPDNGNCAAPINQVTAELVMNVEIQGKNGLHKIQHKVFSVPRITWIAAHTSVVFEKDFEFEGDVKLPEDLNTGSVDSPHIKCSYSIFVKIHYDVKFVNNFVVICLPLHVNPSVPYNKDPPVLPTNWDPVTEERIKLFLNE